jgi:hypothetical protein
MQEKHQHEKNINITCEEQQDHMKIIVAPCEKITRPT